MTRARAASTCDRFGRRVLAFVLAALASPSAMANIEIRIPNVSAPVAANIRGFLSLTRYAERDDVTPETMGRLQRRIITETREALQPLGYYDPQVTYQVEEASPNWRVTINVRTGRPVRFEQVSIRAVGDGAQQRSIREVTESDPLRSGARLNHGAYERVKGDLLRAAKNEGFLDAAFTRSELTIDRAARRADVDLELSTGQRYHYGDIHIAQDVITDEAMRRLLRMQTGDPYTLDSLLRTQYVLDDSLYFSVVDIDTGELNREAHTVPLIVTAEPNRRHRYAASVGYGTDTRVRGKFTWDDRRVNRRGHRFKLELLGSSIVKQLTARYVVPVMDIALEKLEFTAGVSEEELGDTFSEREEVAAGLTEVLGRWQRVLFLRVLNETSTLGADETNSDFLLIPGISYSTMPSYIVGGRARPYFLFGEVRGSPSTLGSDASFLQVRLQAERVHEFNPLWNVRVRGELGASQVADFSELPVSQRFFAGGERSVRGFALNELSPVNEQGENIGGENLASGSIELTRNLPRSFSAAVFYDIGNAFDSFANPEFEYSVGVGARYNVAVASFGVDVAQALSESGRNPRLHLYIATQF